MNAADWILYSNQGATRNQPLSPRLVDALSYIPEMGLQMEVFSGGQPAVGTSDRRVGSTRHDHGHAADVFFRRGDERLDWANPQHRPVFEQIVQRGREAGITGFGAGEGYMQPGSMHIGFGNEAVWGADGKGANAPDWLRNAFSGASSGQAQRPSGETLSFPSSVPQGGSGPTTLADMFDPSRADLGFSPGVAVGGDGSSTRRAEMAQREDQEKRRMDQERRVSLADLIRY